MEPQKWTEQLPCVLTEDETLQKGKALAKLEADLAAVEDKKKRAAAEAASAKKEIESKIRLVGLEIRTGKEAREVEVYEAPDYDGGRVEIVRSDTGEIVRTRPMKPSERQTAIPIDRGKRKK